MKYVPKAVTRLGARSLLKLSKHSPTILVVTGVVGFGATAVMAARATRKIDPVIDHHKDQIETLRTEPGKERGRELAKIYWGTAVGLGRIYGPTVVAGSLSAAAVLSGHNILRGRHVATIAAYSGLMDQFKSYRGRVSDTLGEKAESDIYNGARGEWVEDPDHKGEYKLKPVYDENPEDLNFCRPWFDETNRQWTRNAESNYLWLKGVQSHMNNLLQIRGHVFLNEVFDALHMPRCPEGQQTGWVLDNAEGDGYIDFGFMTSDEPAVVAFRNGVERTIRLNFNIDGIVWDKI